MRTHDLNIDDRMILPKGTFFWSIYLQENVCTDRDKVVRIDRLCIGSDCVFAVMQEVYENAALAQHTDDDSDPRSYVDTRNEISINAHDLVRYVPPPNLFKGWATAFYASCNNSGNPSV